MPRRISGVVLVDAPPTGDDDGLPFHPVDGTPIVRRVADELCPVVDELVVNCRVGQRDAVAAALDGCDHPPRMATDVVLDGGPVYGLRTALRVAAGDVAVVTACDMPFVEETVLAYLRNRARSERADCVVAELDGRPRPRCGAYAVDRGRQACEAAVARGEDRLSTVLRRLDPVVVSESTLLDYVDERALRTVGVPADLSGDDTDGEDSPTGSAAADKPL